MFFILTSHTHEQNTSSASHGLLQKPSCNTSKYSAIMYVSLCVCICVFAPVRIYACVYVYAIIHSLVRIKVLRLILCLIDI